MPARARSSAPDGRAATGQARRSRCVIGGPSFCRAWPRLRAGTAQFEERLPTSDGDVVVERFVDSKAEVVQDGDGRPLNRTYNRTDQARTRERREQVAQQASSRFRVVLARP